MNTLREYLDALLTRSVVARFLEAGPVVPFKPKPGVPTLTIVGRKYALSTDGGPLGDRDDEGDHGWAGRGDGDGGARLIVTPQTGSKFKYLWAYDTDKQYLAMWRASDGNEKFGGRAASEQARIVKLDKKGQLNRVTNVEFRAVEAYMRRLEDEALREMERLVEDSKDESTKQVDRLVREFYERFVESKLMRALDSVERGAVPLGFKPFGPSEDQDAKKRQAMSFVLGQVFQREMSLEKVEDYLRGKGVDVEYAGQWIDWAIGDVRDAVSEKVLPPR